MKPSKKVLDMIVDNNKFMEIIQNYWFIFVVITKANPPTIFSSSYASKGLIFTARHHICLSHRRGQCYSSNYIFAIPDVVYLSIMSIVFIAFCYETLARPQSPIAIPFVYLFSFPHTLPSSSLYKSKISPFIITINTQGPVIISLKSCLHRRQ